MASTGELEAWAALGGRIEEKATGKRSAKTWIAPDGKKFKTWKEASAFMEATVVKREAQASPDIDISDCDKGRKRAAKAPEPTVKDQPAKVTPPKGGDDVAAPSPAPTAKKARKSGADAKAAPEPKPEPMDTDEPAAKTAKKAPAKKRAAAKAEPLNETEEAAAAEGVDGEDNSGAPAPRDNVGSGRRAAQGVVYKEVSQHRSSKADELAQSSEPAASSEADAFRETATARSGSARRLLHFSVCDEDGELHSLDRTTLIKRPLRLTGAVYPEDGPLNKPEGRLLEAPFGPIVSWYVRFTQAGAIPVAVTATGSYALSKPAQQYRRTHTSFEEQAALAWHVVQALDADMGGNPTSSLDQVVARLARAKAGKGYGSAREALLLSGRFVLEQLAAHDSRRASGRPAADPKGKAVGPAGVADGTFATELKEQLAKGPVPVGVPAGNGISIRDTTQPATAAKSGKKGAAAGASEEAPEMDALALADEELARRLQAKMDAQEAAGGRGRGSTGRGGAAYIKISEAEIADDYPMPQQYKAPDNVEEMDELLLFDEELADADPEDLPKRLLSDFSIYNAEGFFASLELLPMWSGVDPDVELFASGFVKDDEGDWGAGGQPLEPPSAAAGDADAAGDGSSGGGSGAPTAATEGPDPIANGGMRLYLSQIREWVVEYSADTLFISLRTDAAWYKLCRPNPAYAPWFGVPLKAARVALAVIQALTQQARASRLSFTDVVKMLAATAPGSASFISKRPDTVERYLVVHGQILLNQIAAYPSATVQRSPFAAALRAKMEARKHSKLFYSKRGFSKAARTVNRNPMKDRASSGRPKPMPATATTMVRSIWQNYFYAMEDPTDADKEADKDAGDEGAGKSAEGAPGVAREVDDDEEDEEREDDAAEDALAGDSPGKRRRAAGAKARGERASSAKVAPATKVDAAAAPAEVTPGVKKVTWSGTSTSTDSAGRTLYTKAQVGPWAITPGSVLLLEAEVEGAEEGAEGTDGGYVYGLVQCMWQDKDGDKLAQVRLLVPGVETVLGDAAADAELFVTDEFEDIELSGAAGLATVHRLEREWDADLRGRQFDEDEALRRRNAAAKAAGKPLEYFYRHQYLPMQGMFRTLPADLGLGSYVEPPAAPVELALTKGGFIKADVEYKVGDLLYVKPDTFDAPDDTSEDGEEEEEEDEAEKDKENKKAADAKDGLPAYASKKGRYHKGSCAGLRAWGLARLLEVKEAAPGSRGTKLPGKLKLQRFFRPEDVSKDTAYRSAFWDIYASPDPKASGSAAWVYWVEPDAVLRKAAATAEGAPRPEGADAADLDVFVVKGTYNPTTKATAAPPAEFAPLPAAKSGAAAASECEEEDGLALATMDIFAGCGGLSEGMHQAGAAATKWAIEYEQPAADAFKLNNPEASVFCNNCNVILVAAMKKAGLERDCTACDDARTLADGLPSEQLAALPKPGEVEFICGGPPCQGYSGMNRFNKGNWSMVQNSMVMSFLSYADFYRPRYFLLENVRNFVSHNKSFTFRLTLRTLLDMGYQVRFGVLNAGNYGVPQSRKRTFIWAAAPEEGLPEWPRPRHVFRSPQLTVNLPGGVAYCAVDTRQPGAPLRTVTVRDAIGDMPTIANGHDTDVMEYGGPPESAYQALLRGRATQLRDHICKEMNPLNLERCRCIPKETPGADWRVLLEIVKNDPSREKYNGQPLVPWCLPNTADRHNGWRGLFGRLDLNGHFPTSTTDPQPMGKVGQVFHPNQDRIVSVRECARSQGFPDHHFFSGNVHARHRQVGNAVPPPLAAALGRQLHRALKATHERRLAELL